MGPTQQSPPTTPEGVPISSKPDGEIKFRGELRKLRIHINDTEKQGEQLKTVISIVNKLSSLTLPPSFVHCEKPSFEGPSAVELNNAFGTTLLSQYLDLQDEGPDEEDMSLSILAEKYDFTPLGDWIGERENQVISMAQVQHIMVQLISVGKFLVESGLSEIGETWIFGHIHVVRERDFHQFAEDYLSSLKYAFSFEEMLEDFPAQLIRQKHGSLWKRVGRLWITLLKHTLRNGFAKRNSIEVEFPQEAQMIQEITDFDAKKHNKSETLSFLVKIESFLKQRPEVNNLTLLNLGQSQKPFIGREEDLLRIDGIFGGEHEPSQNNIIIVHGRPGSGKTAFIDQVGNREIKKNFNFIRFNAASTDLLTTTICACASHSRVGIDPRDYCGNPKALKNVFQEILYYFSGKHLITVIDNVGEPTSDILELIHAFKEDLESEKKHYLILEMKELWTSFNSVLDDCTRVELKGFNEEEQRLFMEHLFLPCPDQKNEMDCPAYLKLKASFMNAEGDLDDVNFAKKLQSFSEKHGAQITLNKDISVLYMLSLHRIYMEESTKVVAADILRLLQIIEGTCGISIDALKQLINWQNQDSFKVVEALIFKLKKYFLIDVKDKIVRLSSWMQESLKASLPVVLGKEQDESDFQVKVLTRLKELLSRDEKDLDTVKWNIIPHAASIWRNLCRRHLNLAKDFDLVTELIATAAKNEDKFQFVVGFLKEAMEILTSAYSNPNDLRVLKLKFILAKEYLLPSKTNEAFIVFKGVQEQCRTEPREFLMLKLRSLIELGLIYSSRREYEKAISSFQQVQIFAVQKISTIQLDSEPTVLKSRMLHGYTFLLQGNLEEGKKILLQVIPLLEKYAGPEIKEVKALLLQAKFYLATLLRKSGDLVNALMMQKRILKEREKQFGRKHPDTWASRLELAMLYSSYDNHEKALVMLRELLDVQEEVLGAPSNRQSLSTMNAIAEIEAKLGNFEDALELYEAIDLIEQQVLPESDEMRISSQLNQAEVLMSLGQYKEANDIFDLVYTLKSTSENQSSQDMALCETLSRKREKVGRSMEILGNYWCSLTPEDVDNPSELAALAKKHEVATELSENQDYHGALRFLKEVLEDCEHLDETNRFHLNVKADTARVLGLVGKFNESFSLYKEIIPLMDAIFGETDELTMLCKDTMGQVFLFSGNQFLKRQMSNLKWFLL